MWKNDEIKEILIFISDMSEKLDENKHKWYNLTIHFRKNDRN